MVAQKKYNSIDVANLAGVSQATVSRVFKNNPHVKESVRQHVLACAMELNYSPRKVGAGNHIILEMPRRLTYYFSAIQDGVRDVINGHDYSLEILDIENIPLLSERRAGGVITVSDLQKISDELRRRIMPSGTPLITINNELDNIPSVSSDHAAGVEMAVDHLVEHGHSIIACVIIAGGEFDHLNFPKRERIRGYQKAMKKNCLEYDRKMIFMTSEERLVESIAQALNRGATAIIMAEEGYGLLVQYALGLLNRKVPEDVSVISYEAPHISPYLQPAQTTIDQDVFSLGQLAARKMISIIEGTDDLPLHVRLHNKLHFRDSVISAY